MTETLRRKHNYIEQSFYLAALDYDFSQGMLLRDHFLSNILASLDG